jgi:hypothetical protein
MPELATAIPPDEEEKDSMPTMGFLDHLEELRKRIIYSIVSVAVGFFACWWKVEKIYDYMQRPIMEALRRNGMDEKLVYLNPTEPFNLYLKIAALAGLFLTSPFRPACTARKNVMSSRSWYRRSGYLPRVDISATDSSIRTR